MSSKPRVIASYRIPHFDRVDTHIDLSIIFLKLEIDGVPNSTHLQEERLSVSDFIIGVQKDILLLENEIKNLKEALKNASK